VTRDPIVIAGAGMAGLSLAVHLIDARCEQPLVLLEPRAAHTPDRTWCFFDTEPHPFEKCVSHRWSRWRVRAAGGEQVCASERYRYQHLPSEAFYAHALERIAESGAAELVRGARVMGADDLGDHVRVHTDQGELRASVLFDSRPPRFDAPEEHGEVRLLQHFVGWTVRTARPVFDPHVCTLMDFYPGTREGVHFTYVLPFDAHTALVEDTWFGAAVHPRERYEQDLARTMAESLGAPDYDVLRVEEGVIPMTTEPLAPARSPRVQAIGLAGGLAKPSTGYAFVFVQRHSRALARSLVRAGVPDAQPPRAPWTRMLDRVFLWVLRERPEQAPELFLRMFRGAPPDALVRFLGEASTFAEDLQVMRALPAAEFSAAAWRARHLWLRGR
jgi:lycopene beta-cyclase